MKIKTSGRLKLESVGSLMEEILSPESMKKYGEMAAEMIRLRTRLGSGVEREGAEKQKLKPLADSTKKQRQSKKKSGKLSSLTTPNRSNLTDTGQMLDSIRTLSTSRGKAKVGPVGNRSDGKLNERISEWVSEAGRPFNSLTKVEQKRLLDAIKRDFKATLKSRLTKP